MRERPHCPRCWHAIERTVLRGGEIIFEPCGCPDSGPIERQNFGAPAPAAVKEKPPIVKKAPVPVKEPASKGNEPMATTCPRCGGPKMGRGFTHQAPCTTAAAKPARSAPVRRKPRGSGNLDGLRDKLVAIRASFARKLAEIDEAIEAVSKVETLMEESPE